MKMPPYANEIPKSEVKTFFLFKMVPNYGDVKFIIRPCKRSYRSIVSTNDRIDLGPACYFFDHEDYVGATDSQIIFQAALEGISIDFEVIESYDGKTVKIIDLRKNKLIFDREAELKSQEKAKR